MALYYVTYDLKGPGQNYQKLWKHLTQNGAKRVLESVWAFQSPYSPKDVWTELRQFVDQNDRLLVINSLDSWWTTNLLADPNKL